MSAHWLPALPGGLHRVLLLQRVDRVRVDVCGRTGLSCRTTPVYQEKGRARLLDSLTPTGSYNHHNVK